MTKRSARSDETQLHDMIRALAAIQPVTLAEPAQWRLDPAGTVDDARQRTRRSGRLTRRASLATACAVAVLGTGAVIVTLTTSPTVDQASALPILAGPPVDASWLRWKATTLRRQAADFTRAHPVSTPNGKGYVMTARGDRVCLAVPDDGGGYGQSCATREQIDQRGLVVSLTTRDASPATKLVLVLPRGSHDPVLHANNTPDRTLSPIDGVVSLSLTGTGHITYQSTTGTDVTLPFGKLARCFVLAPGASKEKEDTISKQLGLPRCGNQVSSDAAARG